MIFESIVITLDSNERVHIAPMGIRTVDGDTVIAPFKPSTTLANLHQTGVAVVNFTDDVRVFAGCLTGRRDWPTRAASRVRGRVLEQALAHRELRVERFEDDELRPAFFCSVAFEESHRPFRGFNRAQAAVIEAAILISRLDRLPQEKIDSELEYLNIAIEKTAGPREREAWGWLIARVDAFRGDLRAKAGR